MVIQNPKSKIQIPPQAAVIVLNWNGARLLPECLSALGAQTYRDFELWLVDNGSIDGSWSLLDDLTSSEQPAWLTYPLPHPARIIKNADNLGFAAGNNQAIRLCASKYVVTLNNDAIPEPDWLAELVSTAESSPPQTGMVASTMLFAHLPGIVASAGLSIHCDGSALERGMGLPVSAFDAPGPVPVFAPTAGAALYRADLLRDTGLFDERYFSYLEDADLAWRARWRGWRALHSPRARVRHIYSATGKQESPFKRRHLARNRVWTIYKNMPETLLERQGPNILRYDLLAILRGLLANDRHSIHGRLEALSRLHEFTLDRRKITTSARLHPDEMEPLLSPALTPRQALKYRKRLNFLLNSSYE
ncbi:MAG: glycosyltransferase family 2 protein [Chloroflexia bacterium]